MFKETEVELKVSYFATGSGTKSKLHKYLFVFLKDKNTVFAFSLECLIWWLDNWHAEADLALEDPPSRRRAHTASANPTRIKL